LPWERWIPKDGKITVTGKSVNSKLSSVRTCQSMVKKAVIEKLKKKYKMDWFPETGAEFTIGVSIFKDVVQVTLDTSGPGLNRRGYRTHTGEVPIKETLAAALVFLSSWNRDQVLIDPMCGAGTILIEAAMIARNIAPGLKREFASEKWPFIEKGLWERSRLLAKQAINLEGGLKILGYDIDPTRIRDSRNNAQRAGVQNDILFEQKDIKDLRVDPKQGIVITNPPYGVKLGRALDLGHVYRSIDHAFREEEGWSLFILTADRTFPQYFKRSRPDKIRKLYNGTIEVHYYQYSRSNLIGRPKTKGDVSQES